MSVQERIGIGKAAPAVAARARRRALWCVVALAWVVSPATAAAEPNETVISSRSASGLGPPDSTKFSGGPVTSGDGRYVAFYSESPYMAPDDPTPVQTSSPTGPYQTSIGDIYVRDHVLNETRTVSIGGVDGSSSVASISGDGRYVVFRANFNALAPGDHRGISVAGPIGIPSPQNKLYLRDMLLNTVTLVTRYGTANDPVAQGGWISADGRYVAFDSQSISPPSLTGQVVPRDVCVRDMVLGVTTVVGQGNAESISADGRYVTFSGPDNPATGDTNGKRDVYMHDRQAATTTLVSRADGALGNDHVTPGFSMIAADGRFVVFGSDATNLVAGARGGVFVRDLQASTTTRVTHALDGTPARYSGDEWPSISGDGRFVSFPSGATNLVAGDVNARRDVFVRDMQRQTTAVASRSSGAGPPDGNGHSGFGAQAISRDGRFVAFDSLASNLVAGSRGGAEVYRRELGPARPPSLAVDDVSVDEGDAGEVEAEFSLSLSHPSAEEVSVDYVTADGSAKADEDYRVAGGTVTFAAFETHKTVSVAVLGDRVAEADEEFFMKVSTASPPARVTVARAQAAGTIIDDDGPPHSVPVGGEDDEGKVDASAPAAGFFAPTGLLGVARAGHTATRLAGGGVLVAGGSGGGGSPLGSAEVYDAASGQWQAVASLAAARKQHSAAVLPGGRVLVVGGVGEDGSPLSSAEVYDAATGRFSATAGGLSAGRYGHSATSLGGVKVLIAGGVGVSGLPLSSAQVYDPATGRFGAVGSLRVARHGHSATSLGGGRVLIAGGRGADGAPVSAVEVYDAATRRFSLLGSLSVARHGHSATSLGGGRVLIAGGRGVDGAALSSVELYDPVAGLSSCAAPQAGAGCPGALEHARYGHSATVLADGRVMVAGGLGRTAGGQEVGRLSVEVYDRAGGTWSAAGRLATLSEARPGSTDDTNVSGRALHSATRLADGRLLVAGGVVSGAADARRLRSAELFDPRAPRRFEAIASRPGQGTAAVLLGGPKCRGAAPAAYCGKVLVAGSGDPGVRGTASTQTQLYDPYDPLSGSWSGCAAGDAGCAGGPLEPANLKVARSMPTLTLLDGPACAGASAPAYCGKVLAVGGASVAIVSGDAAPAESALAELYDPETGRWTSCASPEAAGAGCPAPYAGGSVRNHSATLLADGRVLVAGGYDPPTGPTPGVGAPGAGSVVEERYLFAAGRKEFYVYDPASGRWGSRGVLYNGRQLHKAVLLQGSCADKCGKVLLIGGAGDSRKTAEVVDPASGTSVGTPAVTRDRGHSATLLAGGEVLVAGGYEECNGFYCLSPLKTTEFFDPKAGLTGNWGQFASLLARRARHTATALGDGRLLLAGGVGDTDAAELYDPPSRKSVYVGQSAVRGDATNATAIALPSGPRSLCQKKCGKVLLFDSSSGEIYTPNPEIAKLSSGGGPASGGTGVTIEGRGLASVTSVKFGNAEASFTPDEQNPDTKLVVVSPRHVSGTAAEVPVTAISSGGTSVSTSSTRFTYTGVTAPPGDGGSSPGGGGSMPGDGGSSPGDGGSSPGGGASSLGDGGSSPGGGGSSPGGGGSSPDGGGSSSGTAGAKQGGGGGGGAAGVAAAKSRREQALRACLARVKRHAALESRAARRGSPRRRAQARRHLASHRASARRGCLARHAARPGTVAGLTARAVSPRAVLLSFQAAGSDGSSAPAARGYVVKQSLRPIRNARDFRRAQSLCGGACRLAASRVGERLELTVTDLRPNTTYYYAIAARDDTTRRLGATRTVRVRTR